jgi:mono/diheme cytochrome c family protein
MRNILFALAFVVAGCDKTSADVTIKSDKPGEVKVNGKDVGEVHIEKDGKKVDITADGVKVADPGGAKIDINAGGVNVAAPGANIAVGPGGVSVTAGGGDATAQAEQIFSQRCSVCHGMGGKGDGPGAAALNPKPQNYTDAKFQAEVTDDTIAKAIVEGGQAVGKSPLMAPNADLKDKPDVVKALVAKVRSFKGK